MKKLDLDILEALDAAVRSASARRRIDEIAARVERMLVRTRDEDLAWEPIPLETYPASLPAVIRSSWVFVLRARTATGAERHPNSHQRMMSYRGEGDLQTRPGQRWRSHFLHSDRSAPLRERWISIPPGVWHQGVVSAGNWVVVSFHTVPEHDLIEERLESEEGGGIRPRRYLDDTGG